MSEMLIGAIAAQPDDDLARLAYADWLEETGRGEQALFVRLQVEAARLPAGSPGACRLEREAEAILAENERTWLGEWADRLVRWSYRRGFLDSVTLEPEVFLTHGEELFGRHPVREVRFVSSEGRACDPEAAEELVEVPAFRQVRALHAGGGEPSAAPAWCRALARARHLDRLEELNLSSLGHQGGVFLDGEALAELCRARHLQTLRKLDLSAPFAHEAFGDEGVQTLLEAPFASRLTGLDLSGWHLSDEGARALASSRAVGQLEELELGWCDRLSRGGVQAVLDSPRLVKLKKLSLGGDIDLHALARARLVGRLEGLDLCTSSSRYLRSFPATGWAAFAASEHVARLRRLTLMHAILDLEGARQLLSTPGPLRLHVFMVLGTPGDGQAFAQLVADSPALPELTALELVGCDISHEGVRSLTKAPFAGNLRLLCLAANRIGARGVQLLLGSPLSGGALDDLHLHHCELPPGAVRKLFGWRGLAGLVRLELGTNALDAEAMKALARSPYLRRLTTLHLGTGDFSSEALAELAEPGTLPRLRELTVGAGTPAEDLVLLRKRFGPRLSVDERG